jgi:hypothetical protein
MAQRKGTPLGDSAVALVSQRWTNYNSSSSILVPGPPPKPQVKEKIARTWDYPSYFNSLFGSETGREPEQGDEELPNLSFKEIRQFSENWEIVRLVIETCKDQLCKLPWSFRLKPDPIKYESPEAFKTASENDPRVKALNDFFKMPDKEHDFFQWLRMLLEEILVCDVTVLFPRYNLRDEIYGINQIDCATIERKVDELGLTPLPFRKYPSNIAYQQKIKGQIVGEYTTDEMLYWIRNPRVNKVYGYSGIEQIITTLNTGIRRMLFQLSHYTEGNIPAMFLKAPVEWTKTQIEEFQMYWTELLSGKLGELAKGWMIPGDADPVFTQKEDLKDDFDEWTARIACYAYSVSPNAFIKNLNRATSEQAREQADEEGMQMRVFITKNVITRAVEKWWGYNDIEFNLSNERPQDSKKQAEIDNLEVRNGIRSIDEIRREKGLPPIGAPNRVYTNNGYIPLTKGDKPQFDVFNQKLITDDPKDSNNSGDNAKE